MPGETPINRLTGFDEGSKRPPLNGTPNDRSGGHSTGRNEPGVKGLIHDVMTLAELQIRLLVDDLGTTVSAVVRPVVAIAIGVAVTISPLAVLLLGIARGLAAELQWSLWSVEVLTAGVAIVGSGLTIALGARSLKQSAHPLLRSLRELAQNLATLKRTMNHPEETQKSSS